MQLMPRSRVIRGAFFGTGMALTPKQMRFADEYLIDLNATAAYKRAGYSGQGNAAESMASQLLSNIKVSAYIQTRMKDREKRTEITQDMVLAEWAKLAFLDPRRFYDADGGLIPIQKLPAEVAAALAGVELTTERSKGEEPTVSDVSKIKFIDKKGALDSVARHLGMFNDKLELNLKKSAADMTDDELLAIATGRKQDKSASKVPGNTGLDKSKA